MKRLLFLLPLMLAGCYSKNEVLVEGGRPVEIHLRGMDAALQVSIPEIDGCEYIVLHDNPRHNYVRVMHYPQCHSCVKRSWPDGQVAMKKVNVHNLGEYEIESLEINGCDYFTLKGWGEYPADIVHRGHCKSCAKKGLQP